MPNDDCMIPEQLSTDVWPGVSLLSEDTAIAQLRAFIADKDLKPGEKLPPERLLCIELGLKRGDLRKALDHLEKENRLWRHVGKGTFLTAAANFDALGGFDRLAQQVSPADVMRARSALEPAIAREAALHASSAAIAKLSLNLKRAQQSATWREYEALDTDFHRQIAEAAGSITLLALFDQLNALRRMVTWSRVVRTNIKPPEDHGSFVEHARILDGITARNPEAAQTAMRQHLRSVESRLFS